MLWPYKEPETTTETEWGDTIPMRLQVTKIEYDQNLIVYQPKTKSNHHHKLENYNALGKSH